MTTSSSSPVLASLEASLNAHYWPLGGGHVSVALVEYDEGESVMEVQAVRYSPSPTGRGVEQSEDWSIRVCVPSVPSPAEVIAWAETY